MKLVAERLLQYHLMHVSFGSHVDTWQGGVVYISVASEHKPEDGLDNEPGQWKKEGEPTLAEFLPALFRKAGFVQNVRLTPSAFSDLCAAHDLTSKDALWAKAADLSEKGDQRPRLGVASAPSPEDLLCHCAGCPVAHRTSI